MPSLLHLPQELRDMIIEIAITTGTDALQDLNATAESAEYAELLDIEYWSWSQGRDVLYPRKAVKPNALPLLLVNRDLYVQTGAVLNRINCACELDVILVEEYQLWATWISVPTFAHKLDCVHVSFRIFPRTKPTPDGYRGFAMSDDTPPAIYWQLHSLLEHSLKCGPVGGNTRKHKGFTVIETLELNVITPKDTDIHHPQDITVGEHHDTYSETNPKRWLQHISLGIELLLSLFRDAYPMGYMLFTKVGTIRFMLDGEVMEDRDLAITLANKPYLPDVDPGKPGSESEWWDRMERIRKSREDAGLKVLPFLKKEH
jgi:hypothetical protein